MKKKFLSFVLAICMIMPCAFILNACGDKCEHNWEISVEPTLDSVGSLVCNCNEYMELPALNETDYHADVTNPDYKIYTYSIGEKSFYFTASNFVIGATQDGDGWQIYNYTGSNTRVIIPTTIGRNEKYMSESGLVGQFVERSVVSLSGNTQAFAYNTNLISIVLPSTLNKIGNGVFSGCTNLTEIVLGADNGNMEIDNFAFNGCTNLQSIYYRGTKSQWDNISVGENANENFFNANKYYYSETQPSVADYIENDYTVNTWHYDENHNVAVWEFNTTNNVENKSFTYSHSEVSLSDTYWAMLKEAENQGMLGELFDNDQEQIEMVTSSATKAEYETKFATWYGTTMGTDAIASFADGKAIVTVFGHSIQTDYIEINGEVWYTSSKEKAFTFDTTNNSIYAEQSNDYYTIRHVYSIVE
jgi:hypothetical protein